MQDLIEDLEMIHMLVTTMWSITYKERKDPGWPGLSTVHICITITSVISKEQEHGTFLLVRMATSLCSSNHPKGILQESTKFTSRASDPAHLKKNYRSYRMNPNQSQSSTNYWKKKSSEHSYRQIWHNAGGRKRWRGSRRGRPWDPFCPTRSFAAALSPPPTGR
jgi:hypothetical protein